MSQRIHFGLGLAVDEHGTGQQVDHGCAAVHQFTLQGGEGVAGNIQGRVLGQVAAGGQAGEGVDAFMHGHIQADGDGRDSDDGQPIADGFAGGSGLGYGRIPLRNGK